MRLCSYIVKRDAGLAPNPFWEYCTLAVCTPNHMGIKLEEGDWIVGFLNKKRSNRLLYAMRVRDILDFTTYYKDSRFTNKIPDVNGSWRRRCGDNFYFKNSAGKWERHPTMFHRTKAHFEQDTRNPYVFVSDHFFYFGASAIDVPDAYGALIVKRQGVKCHHDSKLGEEFVSWLEHSFEPGIHGKPIDNPDLNKQLTTACS